MASFNRQRSDAGRSFRLIADEPDEIEGRTTRCAKTLVRLAWVSKIVHLILATILRNSMVDLFVSAVMFHMTLPLEFSDWKSDIKAQAKLQRRGSRQRSLVPTGHRKDATPFSGTDDDRHRPFNAKGVRRIDPQTLKGSVDRVDHCGRRGRIAFSAKRRCWTRPMCKLQSNLIDFDSGIRSPSYTTDLYHPPPHDPMALRSYSTRRMSVPTVHPFRTSWPRAWPAGSKPVA